MPNDLRQYVWVEKYRPQTIEECILPERIKKTFSGFVERGEMPNLLLSGPPGTGKTTLAKALCRELGYDVLFVNGSIEGRLIDTLRGKISNFASSVSFSDTRKCVLIDEADRIPDLVQDALRAFIEEFSDNCSFVFTCNHPNRISDAIHSRTTTVNFTFSEEESKSQLVDMVKRTFTILRGEGVGFDKKIVAELVKNFYPDFRRVINELQRITVEGSVTEGSVDSVSVDVDVLFEHLKNKRFKEMRNWVGKQTHLDVDVLCRKLYDASDRYVAPSGVPSLVLLLADYSYKSKFCGDMEILVAAMLTEIMANVEMKG